MNCDGSRVIGQGVGSRLAVFACYCLQGVPRPATNRTGSRPPSVSIIWICESASHFYAVSFDTLDTLVAIGFPVVLCNLIVSIVL